MSGARILIVDDDPDLLHLIGIRLTTAGYEVVAAASGEEALDCFRQARPQAVVTDLRMTGMDGHALFARIHAEAPGVPVIILTAHGTIPDAVAATQRGVFSFLTKPFDGKELLARVAEAVALSPPVAAEEGEEGAWRQEIVSASVAMDELLRQARRVADGTGPVLIVGPRGAGKEVLARAIHRAGPRARKPFVVLRGGVESAPVGKSLLDKAAGGILFVDDVGELSPAEQGWLLGLAHEQNFLTRLPSSGPAADVRVIAATSRPLDQAVREGGFRADLLYTLATTTLVVPSLAERREDIPLLAAHFAAGRAGSFSPEAMALLQEAPWPGNVGQLASVVEQALAQSVTPLVPASLVRRLLREEAELDMAAFDEARRAFERDYLVKLLETTGGNVARAARIAQRNRTEFYKLLARHDIDPANYKATAKS